MGSEFVITEKPCIHTAFDQVLSWFKRIRRFVEEVSKSPSNGVTYDRSAHLRGDRVRPVNLVTAGHVDHPQRTGRTSHTRPTKLIEIASRTHPARHDPLHRQTVASLLATSFKNRATRSGTHTGAKTVGFRSLSLIRLVGALHNVLFSFFVPVFPPRHPPGGSLKGGRCSLVQR